MILLPLSAEPMHVQSIILNKLLQVIVVKRILSQVLIVLIAIS